MNPLPPASPPTRNHLSVRAAVALSAPVLLAGVGTVVVLTSDNDAGDRGDGRRGERRA